MTTVSLENVVLEQVRIMTTGKMRNYISYATNLLEVHVQLIASLLGWICGAGKGLAAGHSEGDGARHQQDRRYW
eukprot:4324553-Pyramimonas_sp.AAC.1